VPLLTTSREQPGPPCRETAVRLAEGLKQRPLLDVDANDEPGGWARQRVRRAVRESTSPPAPRPDGPRGAAVCIHRRFALDYDHDHARGTDEHVVDVPDTGSSGRRLDVPLILVSTVKRRGRVRESMRRASRGWRIGLRQLAAGLPAHRWAGRIVMTAASAVQDCGMAPSAAPVSGFQYSAQPVDSAAIAVLAARSPASSVSSQRSAASRSR
jgi:hypothetical protein